MAARRGAAARVLSRTVALFGLQCESALFGPARRFPEVPSSAIVPPPDQTRPARPATGPAARGVRRWWCFCQQCSSASWA